MEFASPFKERFYRTYNSLDSMLEQRVQYYYTVAPYHLPPSTGLPEGRRLTEMVTDNAHIKFSSTNNFGPDRNQYSGGEECPIARNASLLRELDVAEEKVTELLEVAAGALDELAAIESTDDAKVELLTKRFLELVSSVHGCLSSKANLVRDYTPYPRSIYGPRKELELLHEKADFLRSELACVAAETPGVAPVSLATAVSENLESEVGAPQDVGVISGLSSAVLEMLG